MGASHVTVRLAMPGTTTSDVGTPGKVGIIGITGAEFADGGLMPAAFLAITLITYLLPLIRPVMVRDVAVDTGWRAVFHDPATPPLLEYLTI